LRNIARFIPDRCGAVRRFEIKAGSNLAASRDRFDE
jgi:hypothetical protein